jgi:signal transduction histidine kinase
MKDPGGPGDVYEKLKVLLNGENWLSPAAILFVQGAVQEMMAQIMDDSIGAQVELLQEQVQERQRFYEAAADLQQRFPGLGLLSDRRGTQQENSALWVPFDRQRWLVGLAPEALESVAFCIVIAGPTILDSIKQEFSHTEGRAVEFDWTSGDLSEGESLGPSLRGLGIRFSPDFISSLIEQRSPQRTLYGLLVLLVLSLTFFGGYLLWRDVRRELRLAEMRSQFVSSVSHELKTPLTAIRMFAETMRMGRTQDPQVQEEYLDTIVNESQRLTRLLNNVLDFSKIEQGERQYHMQPCPLSEVVEAAARTMAYPLSQQGFRLHVHIEPGLPDVRMDRDAMEQAVLNLLSNAMKYSDESRDIDLRLTRSDGSALLQVVDRGLGIAPEEQGRIFEKYYRIRSGVSERSAGTGLGLALVSHIVTAHGGRIEVESAPGKGSTFSIHMPFGDMS